MSVSVRLCTCLCVCVCACVIICVCLCVNMLCLSVYVCDKLRNKQSELRWPNMTSDNCAVSGRKIC